MDESVRDFFDGVYRRYKRYWREPTSDYSSDPSKYTDSVSTRNLLGRLATRRPGRALDLGAGEGGDAIRLARLGYEVDAIELSAVGADKIDQFARAAHVSGVNILNMAAEEWTPVWQYDVIVCHGLLHYISDKEALLSKMKDATTANGIHSISAFSSFSPVPECHKIIPVYPDSEDGIIARSYTSSWSRQIWLPRLQPERSHPGFEPHQHSFVKLLAVRQSQEMTEGC